MPVEPAQMKEFRLVLYMNGSDAINFWGGRAAASPLAYCFHINKQKNGKVLLGSPFVFQGLGEYGELIKDELENDSGPISLPKQLTIKGEHIRVSKKAYIYQNNDPLFTQAEQEVYWEATIDKIGRFTQKEKQNWRLAAVQIGSDPSRGRPDDKRENKWQALASKLVRFRAPC